MATPLGFNPETIFYWQNPGFDLFSQAISYFETYVFTSVYLNQTGPYMEMYYLDFIRSLIVSH